MSADFLDPVKWEDVVFHESDDDELITVYTILLSYAQGETSAALKISNGYTDPLGIVKE